jgi:hypothetical protein
MTGAGAGTAGTVQETWTYGGVRVGARHTRVHAWIDPAGEELWFPKAGAHAAVGSRYTVSVRRSAGTTSIIGVPEYAGRSPDDGLRQRLWAAHTAATTWLQMIRDQRNDAKHSALDQAIAPLLDLARTLRTSAERDALAAYVIRKLHTTWN